MPADTWLEPWTRCDTDDAERLASELRAEVGPSHPLYGTRTAVLGRRLDNDDVVLTTDRPDEPIAVVHLTWSGDVESGSKPWAVFFASWEAFASECMRRDAARHAS